MSRGVSYASQQSDASTAIRQRFSSTSYVVSVAGILKFILIVLLLVSGIYFLSMNKCPDTADWYVWMYPTISLIAAIISLILYSVFLFAIAKSNLNIWATVDVTASLILAIGVIIASILSITECSSSDAIYRVPAGLGIAGAVLLAGNAAATYIMAKYQDVPTVSDEFEDLSRSRKFIRRFTLQTSQT